MMRLRRPARAAAALGLLLSALTACEAPRQAEDAVRQRTEEAQQAVAKVGRPGAPSRPGTVVIHEGIWVGGRSIVKAKGDPLPAAAESASAIVLNSMGAALDLREVAAEVTAQTGLPVVLDDRPDTSAPPGAGRPSPGGGHKGMALSWSGPLSGLLDSAATYFGMQWEYRSGQVRIFKDEVRTFTLAALPSNSTIRSDINTTGGGTSGGSGSVGTGGGAATTGSMVQDTAHETTIKLWDDIKATIQSMLPDGAKATMSPATGTVTVIAPPLAMRRVAAYIEQQNARITRQITVSVRVLRVDVNNSYDIGLDLGVVFRQLAGQYAVNLAGPLPIKPTAGTSASYLVQAINNTKSGKGLWATGTDVANTTHAVIDALQTMGKVTLMTETSVTTLNGQAAPVSVAEQQSYVASTATTLASGAGATTQTQVTPATLVTGFNMQVLPRILDDGEVLLQYGLSLSDLKALNAFDANGTRVQLPDVNIRSFLQEALMNSGDLLVLAGYQSASDNVGDNGLPGLGPSPLGGSVQAGRAKSIIVIMMTPQIMGRRAGETL